MIKNTIFSILASIIPMLVSILITPEYLKIIGNERFGILMYVWIVIGYFTALDLGLGRAAARQALIIKEEDQALKLIKTTFHVTILISMIGGLLIVNTGEWLILKLININNEYEGEIIDSIKWMPIALSILMINAYCIGILQNKERFISISVVVILGDVSALIFPYILAKMDCGSIDILFAGAIIGKLVSTIIIFLLNLKNINKTKKVINKKYEFEVKELLKYGGWASTLTMLGPLTTLADRALIGRIAGGTGITVFSIPFNLVTKLSILPNSIGSVLYPRLVSADQNIAKNIALNSSNIIIALMTPISVFIIGFGNEFMELWLGKDFSVKCFGVIEVSIIGIWFSSVTMPITYYLYAMGTQKRKILLLNLLEIPFYLILIWYFVTSFGVIGAALAWSIRCVVNSIWTISISEIDDKHKYLISSGGLLILFSFIMIFSKIEFIIKSQFTIFILISYVVLSFNLFNIEARKFVKTFNTKM